MYLGHMVELTESAELYRNPLHPYTQMLLSAIPIANPDVSASRKRLKLIGEIPSPLNPPAGCPFVDRCDQAMKICKTGMPAETQFSETHHSACWLNEKKRREEAAAHGKA